jgi:serine protease Do
MSPVRRDRRFCASLQKTAVASAILCTSMLGAASGCRGKNTDSADAQASMPLAPPPPTSASASASSSSDALGSRRLPSFSPVVKKVDAAVVKVSTLVAAESHGHRKVGKGVGTGFVIDRDGVILTNAHVVEQGRITVQLADARELEAKVVGKDARTDIAVLRVDAHDLPVAALGDSDAVEVGDWVLAIGNPFGLTHTVSVGIVSAKGRTRDDVPLDPSGYYDFLQTDASINPGNSGGPLLDLEGRVVGMNTAIRGGGAQGIGFAIPISMVKALLPKLLRDGKIVRSALGVTIRDLREVDKEEREKLHLGGTLKGALIDSVDPQGPSSAALRPGDIVTLFRDQPIERSAELQWLASTAGVGQVSTLKILREGAPLEVTVRLGELTEPKAAAEPPSGAPSGRDIY